MSETLLGLVVEGLDLGTGPNELDFGMFSPDWSKECSSNAPCPQSHPNHSVFQHHLWHKSTWWLCSGCWNAGFLILVFFLLGGNLPPSSTSLSGRFLLIETLVLAALALVLTLSVLFTAPLFLSLMLELHICGDFHRHVPCSDRRGCTSALKTPALGLSLIRFE